jgi:hypothetical protein
MQLKELILLGYYFIAAGKYGTNNDATQVIQQVTLMQIIIAVASITSAEHCLVSQYEAASVDIGAPGSGFGLQFYKI